MVIPFIDYTRAYRVIRSVLESYKGTNVQKSCIGFAIGGMTILRDHYNVPATLSAGAAAYVVGDKSEKLDVLTYGKVDANGNLLPDPSMFHAWVQAGDDVVDFMAPTFVEIFRTEMHDPKSGSMMFQKTRAEMRHISEFEKAGDFCYCSFDPVDAENVFYDSLTNPLYLDAWRMMSDWYSRPPKKIRRSMPYMSKKNGPGVIELSNAPVDGSW